MAIDCFLCPPAATAAVGVAAAASAAVAVSFFFFFLPTMMMRKAVLGRIRVRARGCEGARPRGPFSFSRQVYDQLRHGSGGRRAHRRRRGLFLAWFIVLVLFVLGLCCVMLLFIFAFCGYVSFVFYFVFFDLKNICV